MLPSSDIELSKLYTRAIIVFNLRNWRKAADIACDINDTFSEAMASDLAAENSLNDFKV